VKQGVFIFFMAVAAVSLGIMLKQCDSEKRAAPPDKVSSS
jgi:hypothetical protein